MLAENVPDLPGAKQTEVRFLPLFALPVWTMLGYWLLLQFVSGLTTLGGEAVGVVAFWAHVGGFVTSATLVKLVV